MLNRKREGDSGIPGVGVGRRVAPTVAQEEFGDRAVGEAADGWAGGGGGSPFPRQDDGDDGSDGNFTPIRPATRIAAEPSNRYLKHVKTFVFAGAAPRVPAGDFVVGTGSGRLRRGLCRALALGDGSPRLLG